MIVYPMGLPPHDDVKAMLDDTEDLSGSGDAKMVVSADRLANSRKS